MENTLVKNLLSSNQKSEVKHQSWISPMLSCPFKIYMLKLRDQTQPVQQPVVNELLVQDKQVGILFSFSYKQLLCLIHVYYTWWSRFKALAVFCVLPCSTPFMLSNVAWKQASSFSWTKQKKQIYLKEGLTYSSFLSAVITLNNWACIVHMLLKLFQLINSKSIRACS